MARRRQPSFSGACAEVCQKFKSKEYYQLKLMTKIILYNTIICKCFCMKFITFHIACGNHIEMFYKNGRNVHTVDK